MTGTRIHIKNMCCPRCINAIGAILTSMNLTAKEIRLGDAVVEETLSQEETESLASKLREQGFELLDDGSAKAINNAEVEYLEWNTNEAGDTIHIITAADTATFAMQFSGSQLTLTDKEGKQSQYTRQK